MTYLFIVIGLSVVNALTGNGLNVSELAFTNISVIAIAFILEKVRLLKNESTKILVYDKIELIKPENRQQLIEDLISKTGITIKKVEIGRIDFVRNTVRIKIYYFESPDEAGFETGNDNWKNTDEF
jgi:hypothetical protein